MVNKASLHSRNYGAHSSLMAALLFRLPSVCAMTFALTMCYVPLRAQCTPSPLAPTPLTFGPLGFGPVNGNKVVSRYINSQLFRVHQDGGKIFFTSSLDGHIWTPREEIGISGAPGSVDPCIAVTATTIAVVFIRNPNVSTHEGDVYYRYRSINGGAWSSPQIITHGGEPAIDALGNDVHLVIKKTPHACYLRFPADQPPSSPVTGEQITGELPACAQGWLEHPVISVHRETTCATEPVRVRVGLFRYEDYTACTSPNTFKYYIEVVERNNAAGQPWLDGTSLFRETIWNGPGGITLGSVGLSMDSNQLTGTTVLAYSYVRETAHATKVVRVTGGGGVDHYQLNAENAIIDVTVRDVYCTGGVQWRYAQTVLSPGWSHDTTEVATGLWFDWAPTPLMAPADVVYHTARDAQAIFWLRYVGPAAFNSVRAVFELREGSAYEISTDHSVCLADPYPLSASGLLCGRPCPRAWPVSVFRHR